MLERKYVHLLWMAPRAFPGSAEVQIPEAPRPAPACCRPDCALTGRSSAVTGASWSGRSRDQRAVEDNRAARTSKTRHAHARAACTVSMQQAHSMHCVSANTPVEICSSYRCAEASTNAVQHSFPLFSSTLQNMLTACIVSLQIHLWRFALHTGVQ